jgi:hypothetical protein
MAFTISIPSPCLKIFSAYSESIFRREVCRFKVKVKVKVGVKVKVCIRFYSYRACRIVLSKAAILLVIYYISCKASINSLKRK